MAEISDSDLFQGFNEGKNKAFAEIYKRYYPGLFSTCIKTIWPKGSEEDAKDIVSSTFQKLYERRSKIDSMPGITRFLYLAVRTGCIDFLRHKGRVMEVSHDPMDLQALNDELDVSFVEKVMQEERVMMMVRDLPERSREVVELYYLKRMRYREIGEQLNISPRTVENQLRFALDKLRNALTDKKVSSVLLLASAVFAGVVSEVLCVLLVLHIS